MLAIYTRVSTTRQKDNYSLPAQEADGIAYAHSQGLMLRGIDYDVYQDVKSGGDVSREDYQRCLADIETGKVHLIWVGAGDRWSRDIPDVVPSLEVCKAYKVKIFIKGKTLYDPLSYRDYNDLIDIFNRAIRERFDIRERTMGGRALAANTGDRIITHIYGYSYKYEVVERKEGHKVKNVPHVNEDEAAIVRRIYKEYLQGRSYKAIARGLNSDHVPTKFLGKEIKNKKTALRTSVWVSSLKLQKAA